jgi:hypothetical protein
MGRGRLGQSSTIGKRTGGQNAVVCGPEMGRIVARLEAAELFNHGQRTQRADPRLRRQTPNRGRPEGVREDKLFGRESQQFLFFSSMKIEERIEMIELRRNPSASRLWFKPVTGIELEFRRPQGRRVSRVMTLAVRRANSHRKCLRADCDPLNLRTVEVWADD